MMLSKKVFLISILAVALILRLYKINLAFPFDYDQEIPAVAAYNFFQLHQITIVGQELSFPGFFLGPIHNWIEFIPYGLCNLYPDCVPYFYIALGTITLMFLYFIIEDIFKKKVAIITVLIFAISFAEISYERIVNSNFFLFPSSVLVLYCLRRYYKHKDRYLLIGGFFSGLAVVNFNPVFIFTPIAFFLVAFLRKDRRYIYFLVSFFLFLINYLPLLIFNYRHGNILLNNILEFIKTNTGSGVTLGKIAFLSKDVMISFYTFFLFQNTNVFLEIFTVVLILAGVVKILKKEKYLLYLPILICITFIGFIFYKSSISDYYFLPTVLPVVILIAIALKDHKFLLVIFTILFMFENTKAVVLYSSKINYEVKKQVVSYIINNTSGESFKVYNDMPYGFNTGYNYLFKLPKQKPEDFGKNLFILDFYNRATPKLNNYYKVYKGKNINVKLIGIVEIVSVK